MIEYMIWLYYCDIQCVSAALRVNKIYLSEAWLLGEILCGYGDG